MKIIKPYSYHISVPNENSVRVEKWTPESSYAEQLRGTFNHDKITDEIQAIIKNPANLKDEQIQKVGGALFEALFDNDLREDFISYYKKVTKKLDQILQVILEINETAMPEVVAYPWELMCLPQKYKKGEIFFATDGKLSFFRCQYQLEEASKLSIKLNKGEKLKIALVVSKPTAEAGLSNVEYQEVKQYLENLDGQQVKFLPVMDSKNSSDIADRLKKEKPNIFHFIGHGRLIQENGKDVGQIAFVNDLGKADWKDAKFFSQLFSGHRPEIVILQACDTGKQSETNAFSSVVYCLMLQDIPVVVAMQDKVSNQTASSFVKKFYSQIIKHDSVDIAVQTARSKLASDTRFDKRDFAIPIIYMNASDGYLFTQELVNRELTFEEKNQLVNALLECSMMSDRNSRDTIIDQLPIEIQNSIKRDNISMVDVTNIVSRCLDFEDGIQKLRQTLRRFEGNSKAMQRVEALVLEL